MWVFMVKREMGRCLEAILIQRLLIDKEFNCMALSGGTELWPTTAASQAVRTLDLYTLFSASAVIRRTIPLYAKRRVNGIRV